ncbi:MAG: RnfABCDGE type electron transport complex subunit A [Clostridia bacterium]|nr:RnfABCDGE type electron transport complex subunit A [Clostridia bacterium]
MLKILTILLSVILVNNCILAQFLGICPFLGVSKKLDSSVGMGVAVTFVMVLATAATWPIQQLLNKYEIGYLQTVVFILVIAALVQLVEMILKKFIPSLHRALGVYLPLITTNCAVLGVTINNIDYSYTYVESLFNALGTGIGFLVAMIIFSGMRQKLEGNKFVPVSFQGVPITLVSASILSLAFMGFSGLVG